MAACPAWYHALVGNNVDSETVDLMPCVFHLVADLKNTRSDLLTVCQEISETDLRHRSADGGWAVIELLAHLPDVDRYYLAQARKICDVPGHQFVYFDEEAWSRDNADAIDREVSGVRLAMAAAHEDVVQWTRRLTSEELGRAGSHPRRGSITVREMIQRIADHDRSHIEQVRAIRRDIGT